MPTLAEQVQLDRTLRDCVGLPLACVLLLWWLLLLAAVVLKCIEVE